MSLEFSYDLLSQPSRSVYIFLKSTEVPFKANVIGLRKGDNRKPEYLKKNPFHTVPFIEDDGFSIVESAAIMRYVAGKYNVDNHWFPTKDFKQNARLLEYLGWHPTHIRKHGITIFIDQVKSTIDGFFGPKRPSDEKALATAKEELTKNLKILADYFLKDKPFIAGNDISIADLLAVCELTQLRGVHETAIYESNPTLKAWVERVKEGTQPYFEEAHADINAVADLFSKTK